MLPGPSAGWGAQVVPDRGREERWQHAGSVARIGTGRVAPPSRGQEPGTGQGLVRAGGTAHGWGGRAPMGAHSRVPRTPAGSPGHPAVPGFASSEAAPCAQGACEGHPTAPRGQPGCRGGDAAMPRPPWRAVRSVCGRERVPAAVLESLLFASFLPDSPPTALSSGHISRFIRDSTGLSSTYFPAPHCPWCNSTPCRQHSRVSPLGCGRGACASVPALRPKDRGETGRGLRTA